MTEVDTETEARKRGLTVNQLVALATSIQNGTQVTSLYMATERSLRKRGLMDDDRMPTQAARELVGDFRAFHYTYAADSPAPAADNDWNPADGVQYSRCVHCGRLISRADYNASWTERRPGGVIYTECTKAPNPDDGPMPPHKPGTIVSPPKAQADMPPDSTSLPEPVIPWIPKT